MGEQGTAEITNSSTMYIRRNWWSGFIFGIGLVAFIDEVVFHQILQWHHFYDRSTTQIGIVSDGLFHAFSWFATIGGLFMLADLRRRQALNWLYWSGAVLIGAGLFQVYDGLIQHKVFQIHQIRYVENLLIYDIVWNVTGVLLAVIGYIMIRRARLRMGG